MLKRLTQALTFALAVMVASDGRACSYHVTRLGGLEIAYPGSLGVAIAVARARKANQLPKIDLSQSRLGYEFAAKRLEALEREFNKAANGGGNRSFSLVLASRRLWTTYDIASGVYRANVHKTGPLSGRPVIVTEFLVIDAILKGMMTIEEARDNGLFVIQDDIDGRVAALVDEALSGV